MFGIAHFTTFLIAGIVLNLYPGPDTMYILTRSISQGKRAGVWSVLGVSSGGILHTCAAACGLSSILAMSSIAFLIVKGAGAAYLFFMGIKMLLSYGPDESMQQQTSSHGSGWRIYRDGLLTNLLNPKVALFFLSFLPQFIDVAHGASFLPFVLLGATFVATGTLWCLMVALFAASISRYIRRQARLSHMLKKVSGIIYIMLGLHLLRSRSS